MNQRTILLLVMVISGSISIAIHLQEVFGMKDSGWFDNRDFYKEINKMDMFDKYPYDSPTITIKLIPLSSSEHEYKLTYGKQSKHIKLSDDTKKVNFDVDGKKKVCLLDLDNGFEKCKKFKSYDDKNIMEFYIQ